MIIHLPPRLRLRSIFLIASWVVSALSWVVVHPLSQLGLVFTLLEVTSLFGQPSNSSFNTWLLHRIKESAVPLGRIAPLGSLLGLFVWQVLCRPWYTPASRQESGVPDVVESEPTRRFSVRSPRGSACSAIAEAPLGHGTAVATGRLACLRRREWALWLHPVLLVHYAATAYAFYLQTDNHLLQGPGQVRILYPLLWMAVTLVWLLVRAPWAVIDVQSGGAWLDDGTTGIVRGLPRRRILRAAVSGDKLLVTVQGKGDMSLRFPGGSISRADQRAIVLDLLRFQGIPTTPEVRDGQAPYRQEDKGTIR